ncbi:MAG TPA: hypothetical protein VHA78_03710 [Candidatus Peribacteraceae bacterium]|nr:hypothetical protein [Candidatus Peribacteraceae bacterium]
MKKVLAIGTGVLIAGLLAACSSTATNNTDQTSSFDSSAMMNDTTDTGAMMNDTGATIDNSGYTQSPDGNVIDGQD